jgi:glycosyltransferase involved in cell wall biosynthesis
MHIGVDGNEANILNRVGSNIYSFKLLDEIFKTNKIDKFTIYLKARPVNGWISFSSNWTYKVLNPGFMWTRWRLPYELYTSRKQPDVFFSPGHYSPSFCPMPLAISIMDLSFLYYPEMFKPYDLYKLKNWTEFSIKHASHIFTISEFNKAEINKQYAYPLEKITVTYPGVDADVAKRTRDKKAISIIRNKYKIDFPYLLYLGTLQPRKNLVRLINAFDSLHLENIQLVIAGKKGWYYEEIFSEVVKLGLDKNVIFTDYLDEDVKNELLRNAICLVLVSLYEGFGIPVAEAMAMGTPVLVSDGSSLKEIATDVGIYVDPNSVKSIAGGIRRAIQLNESKRNDISVKSKNISLKYSWHKAAEKTMEVLHALTI